MKEKNSIHYFEVKDIVTQFCAAFNSIIIGRYTGKTKKDDLRVQFRYAPKQRILHSLSNKAEHITLPIVSVSIASIERDNDRVMFKHESHRYRSGDNIYEIPTPVPVNITINMSIIVRYQNDLDQILANFIPYTDPYIMISWKYPEQFVDFESELRSEILWDGSVSIDQPLDRGEAEKTRTTADTSFIVKAWLFKKHPDSPSKPIHEIDLNFIPVSSFENIYLDEDELIVETRSISAYPLITDIPDDRLLVGASPTVLVEGDNFNYTTSVYISSDTASAFSDPISSYTSFNGIELSSYTVSNDNVLYVTYPEILTSGITKIIVENDAGFVVSDALTSVSV